MDLLPLYLAAERIDEAGAVLRARAQLAGRIGEAAPWASPAASAFRSRLSTVTADLLAEVYAVDALAGTLRARAAVLAHRP